MKISKNNLPIQNASFKGHNASLDKKGEVQHSFYYLYDKNKYNCELELYQLTVDDKYNYGIGNSLVEKPIPMPSGDVKYTINENKGFAYRFKLTDKKTKEVSYAFDNGSVIGLFNNDPNDKYNVVLNNRAVINKNGPMQLIMPDGYNPEKLNEAIRQKAINPVTRTHANKFGGDFQGIIDRLPQIASEGVVRIVGTPYTKDTVSSHKYWTENAFRVAPDFGKEKAFEKLQVELFKNGINWISDAALVNEGFGGVHVNELLRHGTDSFAKDMFNIEGRIKLGALPDDSKHARIKFVNAPFVVDDNGKLTPKNPAYDAKKPTYIQFYDDRLASKKQVEKDEIFDTYDIKTTKNIFEITKHDDAVYPYSFEVSPEELLKNVQKAASINGKVLTNDLKTITDVICDFSNFQIVCKSKSGGLETWDGNVDIPKLNFFSEAPGKDKGALAVRNYALLSGKYWTQAVSNIQLKYLSQVLAGKGSSLDEKMIDDLINEELIPARTKDVVDNEVINNVKSGVYHSRKLQDADFSWKQMSNKYTVNDYLTKKAMDVPLETIPVANNLLSILTTPYIDKKPNNEKSMNLSKYDLYKLGKPNLDKKYDSTCARMGAFYEESLMPKMKEILSSVDGLVDENGQVSDFGKFVISEIAEDLTKYLIVKSFAPDADIVVDNNGNFDFSQVKENEITMQSLGIAHDKLSLENEATVVMNALKNGIEKIEIDSDLKAQINNRFKNRTIEDYRLAEMILDRTESGLGWRIDATKDIVSIADVRSGYASMEDAWDNVISFWKAYNQSVLRENPHAYTTAEITDLNDLVPANPNNKYTSDADAERKFIEQTGITSVANYNYFFSKIPDLFSQLLLEEYGDNIGWQASKEENYDLLNKLDQGWTGTNPGFLYQSPADGVINSYTFVDNHDKPRILHLLATNQKLVRSDFSTDDHKKIVAKCLKKDPKDINFNKVSSLAIATADRLLTALKDVGVDTVEVTDAVAKLAQGKKTNPDNKSEDITFDPTAFGTKSFEIIIKEVLDEAELNGAKFANREEIEANILKSILEPAFDRMKSIYKLMMVLPGSPTDFAGDKVGATGYETKAKNYHQQNRNPINWEWLKKDEDDKKNPYSFVREYNKQMQQIAQLRQRPELSALNNGDTITANNFSQKVQALVRYNDKSTVLILTNSKGASADNDKMMDRRDKEVDLTNLFETTVSDIENPTKRGIKHGITEGTVFKNARSDDNNEYVVVKKDNRLTLGRKDGDEIKSVIIEPEDLNTLILYKVK